MARKWNAYEFNHLLKFGFDPFALANTVDLDIPVEYITGKSEFRGLVFQVNENVLIPRTETEEIIDIAVNELVSGDLRLETGMEERETGDEKQEVKNASTENTTTHYSLLATNFQDVQRPTSSFPSNHSDFANSSFVVLRRTEATSGKQSQITNHFFFADVGTGSGCIGISFAHELQKQKIPFIGFLSDISEKAVDLAFSNAKNILSDFPIEVVRPGDKKQEIGNEKLDITSRLIFLKSDLLQSFPKDIKFDLIFANLPYIPTDRVSSLDDSVKKYEPTMALDGGPEGLTFISRLIDQSKEVLNQNGVLILEVDDSHTDPKFEDVEVLEDKFGRSRFWVYRP